MNPDRVRLLKKGGSCNGPVIYLMSRDQRLHDNWALIFAAEHAAMHKKPLMIAFCVATSFLEAGIRHYDFMLKNLKDVCILSYKNNIPFALLQGNPDVKVPWFVKNIRPCALVTDFDPLRIKIAWKNSFISECNTDIYEVDAHNIVPCWVASKKMEFAAYTFRPKMKKILNAYLEDFPHDFKWLHKLNSKTATDDLKNTLDNFYRQMHLNNTGKNKDIFIYNDFDLSETFKTAIGNFFENLTDNLKINKKALPVKWIKPGHNNAISMLVHFIEHGLGIYGIKRNDPNESAQSNLSPYIHFGQLSAQRAALEILKLDIDESKKESFLEELIIRRELADNFCFYNHQYDSFEGFPDWAKDTLNYHRDDKRDYIYTVDEFENAKTHDPLWNAAQMEMAKTGKMHGYMRMYWAKKILEWALLPEDALKWSVYLNDKYSLDGRDPSGYTGIAWSVGGIHDRAWNQRKVFGKIRYMSYAGCQRKFDVMAYIKKIDKI